MIEFETPRVLLNRGNPRSLLRGWRDKEWWYSGIVLPSGKIYVSWYFARVNIGDLFVFSCFNTERREPFHIRKQIFFLKNDSTPGCLRLRCASKDLAVEFGRTERESNQWFLKLGTPQAKANIVIRAGMPEFTKFERLASCHYGLLHYFNNEIAGTVSLGKDVIDVSGGRGYFDHCYGRLPHPTAWHWIAVQNEEVALSILVNYGPEPQVYAQCLWVNRATAHNGRWVRLDPMVAFEKPDFDMGSGSFEGSWRITSTDVDLHMLCLQHVTDRTRIPPIVPLLARLDHTEVFVSVSGRIRVDGQWLETGEMRGVFEEHRGTW